MSSGSFLVGNNHRSGPSGGVALFLSLLLLTTVLVVPIEAHFPANESSYLNFHIPTTLRRNETWPHTIPLFGSYYTLLAGEEGSVALPVLVPVGKQRMCDLPSKSELTAWGIEESPHPYIFLLERGDCSFARKVRNAQMVGASGVLIADVEDKHLNPDDLMPNDGSGDDVSIPSMMIGKKASDELYKVLVKKETKGNKTTITPTGRYVVAEMAWHKKHVHKKAYLDVWHSPIDTHTKEFLANFSKIAVAFDSANVGGGKDPDSKDEENRLIFHEHPILLDGKALKCTGNADGPDDDCYQLCTNGGKYCHVSHMSIDGKDIVTESLRRFCIRKHYGSEFLYWQYILHFSEYCWSSEYYSNEACIADAFKHSGIDGDVVQSCIKDSGGVDTDENTILQQALNDQKALGIMKSPTVMINGDRALLMFGGLTPANVLYEVCESFAYGEKPHVCYVCMECGDPVACATRSPMRCDISDGKEEEKIPAKGDGTKKKKHWGKWFFAFILIGCGVAGYMYYKKHMEGGGGDGYGSYSLQDAFLSERD
jgi:hypothetical protein